MLDEIKLRREAIGEYPWEAIITEDGALMVVNAFNHNIPVVYMGDMEETDSRDHAEHEFVGHAPSDIDWLIAEVERLRAELNRANVALEVVLRERATLD